MSSIKTRLDDLPVYERNQGQVEAPIYNLIRLILLRTGDSVRCALPSLRGLDVVLTDDAWVCVDRTLNDISVVAWTEFKIHDRSALHEPVQCEQRFYHAHAHMIVATVFAELTQALSLRLHPCAGGAGNL